MKRKMEGMHQMPDGEMMPDQMMKEAGRGKHDMDDRGHREKMKKGMADHEKVKVPWSESCK